MNIEKLRKRFCKDCGYSINSYDDNYFYYKLSRIPDALDKYDKFEEMIFNYETPEAFLDAYEELTNKIINHIKQKEAYKNFNEMDIKKYIVKSDIPCKTIYTGQNIGKTLLSIDMTKANFSALREFDPEIFDNCNTWQDFLKQFTTNEYIINSKYIRQVIMGNCDPKRQGHYEKYLMAQLLNELKNEFSDEDIIFFANDEIVIDIKSLNNFKNKEEDINNIIKEMAVPFDIEVFTLCGIVDKNNKILGYYKDHYNKDIEFKAIDPVILPIAQKLISNEEIEEEDLIFDTTFGPVKLLNVPELKIVKSLNKEKDINR